jgi:hypothetical protein
MQPEPQTPIDRLRSLLDSLPQAADSRTHKGPPSLSNVLAGLLNFHLILIRQILESLIGLIAAGEIHPRRPAPEPAATRPCRDAKAATEGEAAGSNLPPRPTLRAAAGTGEDCRPSRGADPGHTADPLPPPESRPTESRPTESRPTESRIAQAGRRRNTGAATSRRAGAPPRSPDRSQRPGPRWATAARPRTRYPGPNLA